MGNLLTQGANDEDNDKMAALSESMTAKIEFYKRTFRDDLHKNKTTPNAVITKTDAGQFIKTSKDSSTSIDSIVDPLFNDKWQDALKNTIKAAVSYFLGPATSGRASDYRTYKIFFGDNVLQRVDYVVHRYHIEVDGWFGTGKTDAICYVYQLATLDILKTGYQLIMYEITQYTEEGDLAELKKGLDNAVKVAEALEDSRAAIAKQDWGNEPGSAPAPEFRSRAIEYSRKFHDDVTEEDAYREIDSGTVGGVNPLIKEVK